MHAAVLLHLKVIIALLYLSSLEVTNGATVEYEFEASESLLPQVIIMANTCNMHACMHDIE